MAYYEVFIADSRYHNQSALTYSSEQKLAPGQVVAVPLRNRTVSAFVVKETQKPAFATKAVKNLLSESPLPGHALPLARWLADYYACKLSDALRQFAPSKPVVRRQAAQPASMLPAGGEDLEKSAAAPLTAAQSRAIRQIQAAKTTTVLLHGDTGTGKTRIYLELAQPVLAAGRSVLILTPEIALTSQLVHLVEAQLRQPVYVLHSNLGVAERKRLWLAILEASQPVVVIGPRSALFSPLRAIGLIVVDEAHEPAYKQDQSPRYQALRVASQLGKLSGAKVVFGTATPSINDYYLAHTHGSVVRITEPAIKSRHPKPLITVVDMKDRSQIPATPYLSKPLIDAIKTTLSAGQQSLVFLNRRGSARMIMCGQCGWQLLCPNCDIPLVYHADQHLARCHTCGHHRPPPGRCPDCQNIEIIYKSAGTKALADALAKLFPEAKIARFDSDNKPDEHLNKLYPALRAGQIDILVGTQLLAKGFDLPKLGLVGVVAADSSLAIPDFTAEERAFQLLYQVIGRVGRGHSRGQVVIQTYEPGSELVKAATGRDFEAFYRAALKERRQFRFPPYSQLLKLTTRQPAAAKAEAAASRLKNQLEGLKLPVEIIGPAPSFYGRRGRNYYWQLTVKSKHRGHLLAIARQVPAGWSVDLDPADLL